MTVIPESKLSAWQSRAETADNLVLENLIEFREFYEELKNEHGTLMQAYAEAAKANRMSAETFRAKFGLVRRFRDDDLRRWFASGISFDHLDKAPRLAEITHRQPAELLDACIEIGGADGGTMTADEMAAFAMSETDVPHVTARYYVETAFRKVWKLPNLLGWTEEKAQRFEEELRQLIDRYLEEQ